MVGSEAGQDLQSGEASGKCAVSRVGSESGNLPLLSALPLLSPPVPPMPQTQVPATCWLGGERPWG